MLVPCFKNDFLSFLDYDIVTPFPSPPYFLQTLSFTPPCCLLNSPWFLESSSRLWVSCWYERAPGRNKQPKGEEPWVMAQRDQSENAWG